MWWYTDGVEFAYKLLLVEMALAVLINIILNFFWSYLILRQLYRLVCQRGKGRDDFCGGEGVRNPQKSGGLKRRSRGGNNKKEAADKSSSDSNDSEDEEKTSPLTASEAYKRHKYERLGSEVEGVVMMDQMT